ncbi:MAG TPA: hypothetical protein VMU73_02905, partial [Gaiellaceae bacterium]|nr:hypothetical protein [Gaiellaceae bacterium]
ARGMGVRTGAVKLAAFVLSAVPVGMVGGRWAYCLGSVYPQSAFDPLFDIALAVIVFSVEALERLLSALGEDLRVPFASPPTIVRNPAPTFENTFRARAIRPNTSPWTASRGTPACRAWSR